MLEKKSKITIEQVGNGFVVMSPQDAHRVISPDDIVVFPDNESLRAFIQDHFDEKPGGLL